MGGGAVFFVREGDRGQWSTQRRHFGTRATLRGAGLIAGEGRQVQDGDRRRTPVSREPRASLELKPLSPGDGKGCQDPPAAGTKRVSTLGREAARLRWLCRPHAGGGPPGLQDPGEPR